MHPAPVLMTYVLSYHAPLHVPVALGEVPVLWQGAMRSGLRAGPRAWSWTELRSESRAESRYEPRARLPPAQAASPLEPDTSSHALTRTGCLLHGGTFIRVQVVRGDDGLAHDPTLAPEQDDGGATLRCLEACRMFFRHCIRMLSCFVRS